MSGNGAEIDAERRPATPDRRRHGLGLEAGSQFDVTPRGRDFEARSLETASMPPEDAREAARAAVLGVRGSVPAMGPASGGGDPARPPKTLEDVEGCFRPLRPMSEDFDDEIEEAIAEAMAEKYPWTVRRDPSSPPD